MREQRGLSHVKHVRWQVGQPELHAAGRHKTSVAVVPGLHPLLPRSVPHSNLHVDTLPVRVHSVAVTLESNCHDFGRLTGIPASPYALVHRHERAWHRHGDGRTLQLRLVRQLVLQLSHARTLSRQHFVRLPAKRAQLVHLVLQLHQLLLQR